MVNGYAGKFLEIDLTNKKVKKITFSDKILQDYIGGRGLGVKILWDRLGNKWETIDPLGPENILLMLTGPFTGYFLGARICVTGKSPQGNGIIGSTVAGEFGVELKSAGYDGIIFTGKAEKPSYIFICDDHIEIKDASHIWGKTSRESMRYLIKDSINDIRKIYPNYGEVKEPSVLYIGPAGENKSRVAAVEAKYSHAAGYGGYGGVMGSKNLKAVVVKGFGPLPDVNNQGKMLELSKEFSDNCFEVEFFRRWGTGGGGYAFGADSSSEPVRNWQEEWHNEESYKGVEFDKHWVKKYWGDYGCPVTCLKLAVLKDGKYAGAICDNPDYELEAFLGPNLGIFSPEQNIYLSYLIEELGFCGIQGGAILGFTGELFQRGILSKEDLGGINLEWGNVDAFAELARKIAFREGIGDILAEGLYRAALKLEEMKKTQVLKYAIHLKGMAIGAHGLKSGEDMVTQTPIGYSVSVQAGDHTSSASLPIDEEGSELYSILSDSGVYCNFTTFNLDFDQIASFYQAVTGWELPNEKWFYEKGLRILQLQRAVSLIGGPDAEWRSKQDDTLPSRFWEPLPTGPYKGESIDKNLFEKLKSEYYTAVSWNDEGVPTSEILQKLELKDVELKLKQMDLL
ncbi:MAG: aldehyde ferredoxin oxidoreductase C-terminal domain-containing protein [Candidatus Lokiarchaeota archaeon]